MIVFIKSRNGIGILERGSKVMSASEPPTCAGTCQPQPVTTTTCNFFVIT